jgi:hypothetical protein
MPLYEAALARLASSDMICERRPGWPPHGGNNVAYGLGVWLGCIRARTFAPLTPSIRAR